MKYKKERQSVYDRIIELYRTSLTAYSETRERLEKNMRQYLGSYEIDNSAEPATTVRNITYEVIESEILPDIPYPKADPEFYTERREENARLIERLCRSVRGKLPFEELNDLDERYTYIYGGSVWYVEWDSGEAKDGVRGEVKVHCLSPLDFIPQPGVLEVNEMQYCFLRFTTSREELTAKYGVSEELATLAECEYGYTESAGENDAVTVINALYRDKEGNICKLVFSGDLILSDIPTLYVRKVPVDSESADFRDTYTEILPDDVANEWGGIRNVDYYIPQEMPVIIRRNTRISPSLFGLSDCERVRPQQQAINKVESRILKKLLRAAVTPVMPEDAGVTLGNSVFGEVIRMRPGESLENYGKIDTTPDISQDIAEADRLYDHAKRVLGISDALQGTDTTQAESGYARNLKISRAESRLETKKRMKYHAYSNLYKMIFRHYLAFSDEPRNLSYKDPCGTVHCACFNRYAFLESDGDGCHYSDAYLFSVDLNTESDYTREALWERNLKNLESGTLGDRNSPTALLRYWQAQEKAHYPFAGDNVEYFKSLIAIATESEA